MQHVVEVHEDALGRLGSQVGDGRVLLDRAHERLEHQVELPRRRQLALAAVGTEAAPSAAVLARLGGRYLELVALGGRAVVDPRLLFELVGAEAVLARLAIHHRIGEVIQMSARLPHRRVHQNRGVETDHVGAQVNVVAPPRALDVVLELHAERAVVPARSGTTIDLAGLEDEAATLAERNQEIHRGHVHPRSPENRSISRTKREVRVGCPMSRAT